jgi:PPOX class probable F420-dependent enzyme
MSEIPAGAREFLATGPLAHVITLAPDGTPHVSLAWAGFDGDDVIFSTFNPDQHKIRNLRRDSRVTLSFQAREHGGGGLHPYLVIRGRVTGINNGGALDVMDRLSEHYIGPGQKFPMRNVPAGAVVHIVPEKIYGVGAWRESPAA